MGFRLDGEQMRAMAGLERGQRGGPDPETLDFRAFPVEL